MTDLRREWDKRKTKEPKDEPLVEFLRLVSISGLGAGRRVGPGVGEAYVMIVVHYLYGELCMCCCKHVLLEN